MITFFVILRCRKQYGQCFLIDSICRCLVDYIFDCVSNHSNFWLIEINKGISNFLKQTVAMHRWENTLAKHRVLSVTYAHYDNQQLTLLTFPLKAGFSSCIRNVSLILQ